MYWVGGVVLVEERVRRVALWAVREAVFSTPRVPEETYYWRLYGAIFAVLATYDDPLLAIRAGIYIKDYIAGGFPGLLEENFERLIKDAFLIPSP